MLKTILSVAGVLFVGLGVFGGNLLEKITGGNEAVANSVVEVPASTSASTSAITESTQVAAAAVLPEIKTEVAVPVLPVVTATEEPVAVAEPVVAEADGAVPIAPAQAAGDLIAMAEQAKASSRNEQVNMAKSVLTSTAAVPVVATASIASEAVDKEAEVNSVVVSTAGAINSDALVVIKDKVNLRDGPSIDHPIVLTLSEGQELMEFKREGKWVHVGAYGTSGKIGWVHERLVGVAQ